MAQNCTASNRKRDRDNFKTDINVYKGCNKRKEKKLVAQPMIGMPSRNNCTLIVGDSFAGESYLLLIIFSRMCDRDIFIIIKVPLEQYSNFLFKIKESYEEIKPLNEYESSVMVFEVFLGSSNCK